MAVPRRFSDSQDIKLKPYATIKNLLFLEIQFANNSFKKKIINRNPIFLIKIQDVNSSMLSFPGQSSRSKKANRLFNITMKCL